ncbi:MAG: hypothetical protein J3Q66DRAFT_417045 [Benniella sp.]|nr:MAG: hypothetical protein J3Q66DRAFT_417045 [Benniella sp.]
MTLFSGKFVPGSPKRTNDDLEARERSLRLLAERVKSPPAPMQPLSAMSPARRRTIEVKGTTRSIAQPRSNKLSTAKGGQGAQGDMSFTSPRPPEAPVTGQNWVNLDDGSSEEDIDRGSPLLSLSHQRARILQDTRARQSRLLAAAAAATAPAATTNIDTYKQCYNRTFNKDTSRKVGCTYSDDDSQTETHHAIIFHQPCHAKFSNKRDNEGAIHTT